MPPEAEPASPPAEIPESAAAEVFDPGEPIEGQSEESVAAVVTAAPPVLRIEHRRPVSRGGAERLRGPALSKRAATFPGYCNFRRHPQHCYRNVTDRARDGLCGGDPTCEQAFDSSPCIADPRSAACEQYIGSRPCLDDPASFECELYQSARRSYCAVGTNEFYCGSSGSPGAETFGPPGGSQRFVGLFDRGVSGRLALAPEPDRDRPVHPLPMTGYEPLPPLAVALLALALGAAVRGRSAQPG